LPQAINRSAELIECTHAAVDLDRLLGIHAFSLDRLLQQDPDFLVRHAACFFTAV
jgi:G3E family GTPase